MYHVLYSIYVVVCQWTMQWPSNGLCGGLATDYLEKKDPRLTPGTLGCRNLGCGMRNITYYMPTN